MLTTYLFRASGLFVTLEGVIRSYVGSKIQKQSDLDFEEKIESILKKCKEV